jgi:rhamnose utilization protein RhaD (predicted bifunctional aldolase and dehydrogenase)/NAD(P)-dependent dehydrogenase (short-subunit alcohol dehydrogenase family)
MPNATGRRPTGVMRNTAGVQSRWSDTEAAACRGLLAARVYTSRLLGADPDLVMHGGGNTSVKVEEANLFGDPVDVLYVKGSGSDLASVTEQGFAPVLLEHLLRLAELDELTDAHMTEQLRLACTRTDAPAPSVEAVLHAILPARYVDHTHADAVLSITNTPNGRKWIEELYGERVVVIDYVMPGFALARRCAREFPARRTGATVGMVLMHHGIFTFGETARESYERMIELVTMAENFLVSRHAWELTTADAANTDRAYRSVVAQLRNALSHAAGVPMIVATTHTPRTAAFLARDDHADLASRGPLTPDHVIRTKRVPLIGRDVATYVADYVDYFERNRERARVPITMLDPAPRVLLDRELGLLTAGRTARDASVARDVALHTLDAIERADALDAWVALSEGDLFDVEYWELEQAKLARQGLPAPFAGEIALVTGAASGIGRATADAFLNAGAAVVGLDIDDRIADRDDHAFLGIPCDVTDDSAVDGALDLAVARFGGLDMLVLNAGVFPPSARIEELSLDAWRRVMAVNVDANLSLLHLCADLLARAPRHGRVVVNASKNVHAPGPGAAAYSASKASLTQLARVAALEWAPKGIRVNIVHPNAVFDTAIWDEQTLASRAASYGLTVDEYRRSNLLGVEVTSADVAGVILALCSPTFAKTTAAQVPIDGGNERIV